MKKLARSVIVAALGWQVRRLRRRHSFKIVAVVGSIGKTSTKFAIAQLLGAGKKVRYQSGNYNDLVTVPLVLFGQPLPSLFNPLAWLIVLLKNEYQIVRPYPYEVVVVELGTDGPSQIQQFKRYLHVDISVVTAIAPEHMEFFADLDAVAKEELSVIQFSDELLVNNDLMAAEYVSLVPEAQTYSLLQTADYQTVDFAFTKNGVDFTLNKHNKQLIKASHQSIAEAHLYSITAAVAVADLLGLSAEQIVQGIERIQPVAGRMQLLQGIRGSLIIDDSYNASPEAAKAALETLYRIDAPQKIALLGNMNELGDYSSAAHTTLGEFCDSKQLGHVITLGPDANQYLAPAAEQVGNKVNRFTSPYEVGIYLEKTIKKGAVILVKGSQNKVFAEEAIKSILADPSDAQKLVRQSPAWMKKKKAQFAHASHR